MTKSKCQKLVGRHIFEYLKSKWHFSQLCSYRAHIGFVAWLGFRECYEPILVIMRITFRPRLIMPQKHRVRNWKAYNKALRKRGDLFLYFNEDSLTKWHFSGNRRPGGKLVYSDHAIELMLSIKNVLRLPLRQAQGFVDSVLKRLGFNITAPDYSTICRRAKTLALRVKCFGRIDREKPLHLLIDSTGLSVYSGTYFHLTRYQGHRLARKSKSWRKLHIAYDLSSAQIVSAALSEARLQDSEPVARLMNIPGRKIESLRADRAYDKVRCYKAAHDFGVKPIIPPCRNARLQKENRNLKNTQCLQSRDAAITFIRQYPSYDEGVKAWKIAQGYHQRSKVEALMHRFKKKFGYSLQSKTFENMTTEVITKINILNVQRSLGGAEFELIT